MKFASRLSLLCALLTAPWLLLAQSWTGSLERGGVISVDPTTNKATVYSNNGSVQLWDGTHRLQDGSVVIVTDGVVTSRSGSTDAPGPAPMTLETDTARSDSVCVSLAIKVCGFNGECSDSPACSPSRQLMKLERDEAAQTNGRSRQTSAQCREAMKNEAFFQRCERRQTATAPTACQQLVTRVCGSDDQCAGSIACSPAQQLLVMENREREASRDPKRPTYTSRKCSEALTGSDFFIACPATERAAGDDSAGKPGSETLPAQPQFQGRFRQ